MGLVNNFPYVTFSTEWQHWQPGSLPKDLSICKKSTKEFTESWVIILLKGSNVNTVIYTNPTTNSLELPFLQRRMTSPSLFFFFFRNIHNSWPIPYHLAKTLRVAPSCYTLHHAHPRDWPWSVFIATLPKFKMGNMIPTVRPFKYRSALSLLDKVTLVVGLAKNSQSESSVTPGLYPHI